MPYNPAELAELTSTDIFTLWFYTTDDPRAAVLAPGYFAGDTGRLPPGGLIITQTGDSLAFLPVRDDSAVGNGRVLDALAPPQRLNGSAAPRYAFNLGAFATATRSLGLDPVPVGLFLGVTFPVSARVTGPITTVLFRILDAAGVTIAGPVSAAVAAGAAAVSFTAPAAGSGYRIRVQDAADPLLAQTSASFAVTPPLSLLTEHGFNLMTESGFELLL